MNLKSLESEILKLTPAERALMICKLLESLESEEGNNLEDIWINEALSRYSQIVDGSSPVIDSKLLIKEARSRYK